MDPCMKKERYDGCKPFLLKNRRKKK